MASWDGAVQTREEQRENKRRATLRVAARMFNQKGYHGTCLDDVAKEIGVTKAALYYYFKNKEALLYECLKLTYDCGQSARLASEAHGGTAYERLIFFYKSFMLALMEERGAFTTMDNINALPEARREELMDRRRQFDRYSRMLLTKAVEQGALREIDVRLTSNYFIGAANWILRWYTEEDKTPEEIAEIFIDLLMNGIVRPNS